MTAFQVTRFAEVFKPRWLVVENVIHMRTWHRYGEWLQGLAALGYRHREQVLNAADFGVPQARKRLFVICDRERTPAEVVPRPRRRIRRAADVVEANGIFRYSRLRQKGRAAATLARALRAIAALGARMPFLLVYYGSDGPGGWQPLGVPLRTVTTLDRFAYVRPLKGNHEMRMLQVPELKKAMGFPRDYRLDHGSRRDKIRLLGNAVCPPVMKAILETLTRS